MSRTLEQSIWFAKFSGIERRCVPLSRICFHSVALTDPVIVIFRRDYSAMQISFSAFVISPYAYQEFVSFRSGPDRDFLPGLLSIACLCRRSGAKTACLDGKGHASRKE